MTDPIRTNKKSEFHLLSQERRNGHRDKPDIRAGKMIKSLQSNVGRKANALKPRSRGNTPQ